MNPRKTKREHIPNKYPPARNPEQREQQMINYAVDLAEEQLRNGTASSQVITHYLKLGSVTEKYKREKLRGEIELLMSRVKQIDNAEQREKIYAEAIEAMMNYRMPRGLDDENVF